jgi:hypothetical protein
VNRALEEKLLQTIHSSHLRETKNWPQTIPAHRPARMVVTLHGERRETFGRVPLVSGVVPRKFTHPEFHLITRDGLLRKNSNWDMQAGQFKDDISFHSHGERIGVAWGCRDKYLERMLAINSIERLLKESSLIFNEETYHREILLDGELMPRWVPCDKDHPLARRTFMHDVLLHREQHIIYHAGRQLRQDLKQIWIDLVEVKPEFLHVLKLPHVFVPKNKFLKLVKIVEKEKPNDLEYVGEKYLSTNPWRAAA